VLYGVFILTDVIGQLSEIYDTMKIEFKVR